MFLLYAWSEPLPITSSFSSAREIKLLHNYTYFEKNTIKNLNEEEISWIKKNQVIKIAVVKDYEPYDMVDENNKLYGFHSSIVKLINEKLGSNIILIPFSSWKNAYTSAFTGDVNGIFSLSWSKQREAEYFIYSPTYHYTPYHLLVHNNTKDINSLSSLSQKKVAIESNTIFSKIIKEKVPAAKIIYFNKTNDLYKSVQKGTTNAALSPNFDDKILSKYDLKVAAEVYHKSSELYIGVSKKYPLVASIITKGLNSISLKEMAALRKQWFVEYLDNDSNKFRKKSAKDTIFFTPNEKKWIENNPIVKLAVMNFWNTNDNGESIHSDLIKLINKYSNLHVVPVKYDIWKKGFSAASKGDFIHGIMNLSWTKEREQKNFYYTKPYNFTPSQLIIKESDKSIKSINDLKNKTIYLRENSITHKTIDEQTPSTKVIDVTNKIDMYKKLATTNEADAILDYGSHQDKLKKYKLKVVQNVYNRYSEVAVGISKQHKELQSILQKIYQIIPKAELLAIQSKVYEKENLYKLKLTKEERTFIKNHKPIKVGGEMDWAPFDFVDINGEYQGIAKDYLSLVSKMSGLKFDVITGQTWSELLQSFKDKKIYLISEVVN